MPTITITLNIEVPDGATVSVDTANANARASASTAPTVPSEIGELVQRLVPARYRSHVESYIERCVTELHCSVEAPKSDERRTQYLNIYPPVGHRRARVAGITYGSSRTAVYAGPIDLAGFQLAEPTYNGRAYAYPKLANLGSTAAVEEAIELTKRAIDGLAL